MIKENMKVKITTAPSFEGVISVAILEEILTDNTDIEVNYVDSLDYRDYEQFKGPDINIILGAPYKGYPLPQEFHEEVITPFTDFIHLSTLGVAIEGHHVVSLVEEDQDPIYTLYQLLSREDSSIILPNYVTLTAKAEQMVEAVNAYRTWTWEGDKFVELLLALYHAGFKRTPAMIKGYTVPEMIKEYAPLIKGQMEKMEYAIVKSIETSYSEEMSFDGQPVLLVVAFATEYVNEIANELLTTNEGKPTIVCVGRPTQGNDIISIRTHNVEASKIAYAINEGGGKEEVASTFFGASYAEIIGKSIKTKLERSSSGPQNE